MQYSNEKEFWTVGKSRWGNWQIRKTPSDEQPSTGHDTLVEVLKGNILDVKLEFNGSFRRDYNQENFLLQTEDEPWMFVLLEDGSLYAKMCNDPEGETLTLIASRVRAMFPCRGWVSSNLELDIGLYLGYIQDGHAFYALYHKVQDRYTWESGFLVDESDPDDTKDYIRCFRLNDYRIAIYVGSSTGNKLYVSPRLYIGGTFSNPAFEEQIRSVEFVMLNPFRTTNPNPKTDLNPVLTLENESGVSRIRLHTQFPFVYFDNRFPAFNNPSGYSFTDVVIDSTTGDLLLTLDKYVESIHATMVFSSKLFNRLRYKVTDYCQPILPEMTFQIGGDWREQENLGYFSLTASSITSQFVAIKRRSHDVLYRESFNLIVESEETTAVVVRKGSYNELETASFSLEAVSITASVDWSFSGSIIT